jgi:hypothetical protein
MVGRWPRSQKNPFTILEVFFVGDDSSLWADLESTSNSPYNWNGWTKQTLS